MIRTLWLAALLGSLFLSASAGAADSPATTVLLTGLDTPWSVAVQPSTFDVFVSESGAGRVIRTTPGDKKEPQPFITGFATKSYGQNPTYKVGPLGLAFIDREMLVVGGGDLGLGADLVRIYSVPERDKEKLPLGVDDTKSFGEGKSNGKLGPVAAGSLSKTGEGLYFSVAANATNIFAIGQGDPEKGWILKADLVAGKPGPLSTTFCSTKKEGDVSLPFCLTLSKRGEVVVGTRSPADKPHSAVLAFYHGRNGKLLLQMNTGLNEIAGLAYSAHGNLYAIDASPHEPAQAGLYRLDDNGKGAVKPVKIAALDRPTSLAAMPDGTALLVTILGKYPADSNDKPGQLLQFKGL
ncbi:MAG TPA: hypothetical protein VFE24_15735 [Pirellulales bacterium]|nr:hypothetical protein [Pirellulales bacterium]